MRKKSGINMSDVKTSNRSLILNQIKNKPKSRKDIAERINLTPAAVTILVNELIEQGCVKESGQVNEPARVGRKKVLVELNKTYRYAIGVNIEGKYADICIGNLKVEIIKAVSIRISEDDAEKTLSSIAIVIEKLIEEANLSKEDILGIGVGIVGVVDAKHGISKSAYGLWHKEVNIIKILNDLTGMTVVVDNNVRALALAEMDLKANRKLSNMVFIKIGPGIGSAVILDNDVYRGSYNMSGEIGHMIIGGSGKTCRCGQIGCLETVASIDSLIEDISKDYTKENYKMLCTLIGDGTENITEATIMKAYEMGDDNIIQKVNQLIGYLAIGIVNLFKMYDPNKVVIYGKMFNEALYLSKLIAVLKNDYSIVNIEERIEKSQLVSKKCIGGLDVVIRELFYKNGADIA